MRVIYSVEILILQYVETVFLSFSSWILKEGQKSNLQRVCLEDCGVGLVVVHYHFFHVHHKIFDNSCPISDHRSSKIFDSGAENLSVPDKIDEVNTFDVPVDMVSKFVIFNKDSFSEDFQVDKGFHWLVDVPGKKNFIGL